MKWLVIQSTCWPTVLGVLVFQETFLHYRAEKGLWGTELQRWFSGDFLVQRILHASFPEELDGPPAPTRTQWSAQRRSPTEAGCGWSQWWQKGKTEPILGLLICAKYWSIKKKVAWPSWDLCFSRNTLVFRNSSTFRQSFSQLLDYSEAGGCPTFHRGPLPQLSCGWYSNNME